MALYAPTSPRFGRSTANASGLMDFENLAPGSYLSLPNRRFWRRTGNGNVAQMAETLTDSTGPYWDFPAARIGRLASTSADIPWRPGDFGGHAPGTILAVAMITTELAADECLLSFASGGGSAEWFRMGFRLNGGNSVAFGGIRTITAQVVNSPALTLNRPYAVMFTTRTSTDHEIIARDLITGDVVGATSVGNSGTAGITPNNYTLGMTTETGDGQFFSKGRMYLAAYWARSMTQAEMYSVARSPLDLLTPRLPRLAFNAATASVTPPYRPSVFGQGGYSVFP